MSHNSAVIRGALLAAAAHLEAEPASFDRETIYIPTSPSERADGLAWVGFFLGVEAHAETSAAAARALGLQTTHEFYRRMRQIDAAWEESAIRCAAALRAYADRYHGVGQ